MLFSCDHVCIWWVTSICKIPKDWAAILLSHSPLIWFLRNHWLGHSIELLFICSSGRHKYMCCFAIFAGHWTCDDKHMLLSLCGLNISCNTSPQTKMFWEHLMIQHADLRFLFSLPLTSKHIWQRQSRSLSLFPACFFYLSPTSVEPFVLSSLLLISRLFYWRNWHVSNTTVHTHTHALARQLRASAA